MYICVRMRRARVGTHLVTSLGVVRGIARESYSS